MAEVVAQAGLAAPKAEALLEAMCRQELCEHRIADDGTIIYRLQPRLGAAQKNRRQGSAG